MVFLSQASLVQTALDYDVDIVVVELLSRQCETSNVFYEKLERLLLAAEKAESPKTTHAGSHSNSNRASNVVRNKNFKDRRL